MLAIDLCCGVGGWTRGLLHVGFHVIGFDIARPPRFPDRALFVQQDVRTISGRSWRGRVDVIIASPPCRVFTNMWRVSRKPRPPIEEGLALVRHCFRIASEAHAPIIVENVMGAQQWLGMAVRHVGPYYLWGDVPPILPRGSFTKGIWNTQHGRSTGRESARRRRRKYVRAPHERAEIPMELAVPIAWWFARAS